VTRIDVATVDDTEAFLASAIALVASDADRYDPRATDTNWADRTGAAYAAKALSGDNVVLLARDGDKDETVVRAARQRPELVEGEAPVRESGGDFLDTVESGFLVRVGELLPGPGALQRDVVAAQQFARSSLGVAVIPDAVRRRFHSGHGQAMSDKGRQVRTGAISR